MANPKTYHYDFLVTQHPSMFRLGEQIYSGIPEFREE